ncbi:Ribosomal RNA small subunit methyltransferase A [Melia azedarach]|uniref:Ribosomal RNA small subunit methyltransferase A n=1 Tax=Melia azedarach TaxID=155640 RepID=A0ACC1XTR2_MELAZ|nr:Ribosomal RNA small subunit methyltransferase A [Melia azedarach]
MAVSLTRFSWWLWGGNKEKEPVSNGSSKNPSSSNEWTFGDTMKFPSTRIASTPRKVKKKWQSREERRMDREFDVVLVPSDGGVCASASESDDSDWSIGWLEPHGADFQSDDESDNSFAVLVPCYRRGCEELVGGSNNQLLNAIKNLPLEFSPEGNKFMEQWLSSLQNF